MKILGLAFLKNGIKFDYPFLESLQSMQPLVDQVYINVGLSNDGTKEALAPIDKLKIIDVDWDDARSDRGNILSDMTNLPLSKMREDFAGSSDVWVLYLQSDEVLHEAELEQIKEDIARAHQEGCDVVRFRYLHFLNEHNTLALGAQWYPQEIRAFKLNTPILSLGDAQTYSGWTKAFESDAHIYHYGHVREQEAYKQKMDRMHRYYQSGFKLFRKRIKMFFKDLYRNDRLFNFFGDHPAVMEKRIERLGGTYIQPAADVVSLMGPVEQLSPEFLKKINAREVLLNKAGGIEIKLNGIPTQSWSPIARAWTLEFRWLLALSRRGVGLRKL
jgi:hypothetical protein